MLVDNLPNPSGHPAAGSLPKKFTDFKIQILFSCICNTSCYPSILAETMQAEEIRLPESQEDMQLLLLTLREDLITAKVRFALVKMCEVKRCHARLAKRERKRG